MATETAQLSNPGPLGKLIGRSWGGDTARTREIPELLAWVPSTGLAPKLPCRFKLPLQLEFHQGVRRISPIGPPNLWFSLAGLGGEAILRYRGIIDQQRQFSYSVMRLLFPHNSRVRESLQGRSFRRREDLFIPLMGQSDGAIADVLPDDFGCRTAGHRNWSVQDLLRKGRSAAHAAGHENPNDEMCICFGVREESRQNPIDLESLTQAQAIGHVYKFLFDVRPDAPNLDEQMIDRVVERLMDDLQAHIDEPTEAFNHWFFGGFGNLIRPIEKRKHNGGPMPRNVVRQALVQTVFKSYRYMADCVHALMRAVENQITPALNAIEAAVFDVKYKRQSWLGGLPLVLIEMQFPVLRAIIEDVYAAPADPRVKGSLLRAMHTHSEMISRKRESERTLKLRSQARNRNGAAAAVLRLDAVSELMVVDMAANENTTFGQIAAEIREQDGRTCACRSSPLWHAELLTDAHARPTDVRWVDCCANCETQIPVRVSVERFRTVGESILAAGQ